jgi:ATP-binding cassette, subfamily B, bacterial
LHSTDSMTKKPSAQPSTKRLPLARAGFKSSATRPARTRGKKFLSYYKPYMGLFFADMACALIVSAITLLLPLCAQYITQNIVGGNSPHKLHDIYLMGAFMLVLVAVHTLCTMFIDFQGHMMGARMESDMRSELFEHYQKLSFGFYDEQKTGQLMTRITDDTFWLAELY